MADHEPIARDYEELARIFGQMKYFQSEVHSADGIIEVEQARRIHALEQLESYRKKANEALPKVGLGVDPVTDEPTRRLHEHRPLNQNVSNDDIYKGVTERALGVQCK